MFKIEFLTDEKRLGKALTAVAGLVFDLKVVPVVNVIKTRGQVVPRTGGSLSEILRAHIQDAQLHEFTMVQLGEHVKSLGRSRSGIANAVNALINDGMLTRKGKGNRVTYVVRA